MGTLKWLLKSPVSQAHLWNGGQSIADFEYLRRRYDWSKRLNLGAAGLCIGIGAVSLIYAILVYQDWQWLSSHFGNVPDQTRWTPAKISAKLTTSILLMVVGGLGFATGAIGFLFIRKALDDDKVDVVKKWSFIAGITGILPGLAVGGLLELFIWRAHATESFTMFGLLGAAPAPPPPPQVVPSGPLVDAAALEAQRKAEYTSLFAPAPAPAPSYAPQPSAGYYAQPSTQQMDYAYAQAEPQAAPEPAAAGPAAGDIGTQYQQPQGAPICSCGRTMEWVSEYNRYYCYTDDKYEGES